MGVLSVIPFVNPMVRRGLALLLASRAWLNACLVQPGPAPHACAPHPTRRPPRRTALQPTQAWVFAALDDADSSALYYTYALLYALPYLGNGLQLDGWAALSVAVCAAHVQARGGRAGGRAGAGRVQ